MKVDAAELKTFLNDEFDVDKDLSDKSEAYCRGRLGMEVESMTDGEYTWDDIDDMTLDWIKGWKAHEKAVEGRVISKSRKDKGTGYKEPSHISDKRARATDENWLSGEGDTIRQKAIKQVARDDGKDVSTMSEKDRSEYISQNLKKIEAKKSELTDGLAEEIRQG